MTTCMRVFNRIECPTCGYPLSEARYSLEEAPYDPGCHYEREDVRVPDLGEIEIEEGSDDLSEFEDLYNDMADEMLHSSYFGG